jgi:hypothetical protein
VALKLRLDVPVHEGLSMDPRLSDALLRELGRIDEQQRRARATSDGYAT